jgi:hypothetical protein
LSALASFTFGLKTRAALRKLKKQKPKLPRQSLPSQKKSGLAAIAEFICPALKG